MSDVDGLLTSSGVTRGIGMDLAKYANLRGLRLQSDINAFGATAGAMVQYAAMAISTGMAQVVACVFADVPLRGGTAAADAYSSTPARGITGKLRAAAGVSSVAARYALATRRHMIRFGTSSEQLGAVAVAARKWAALNPRAQFRDPITIDDHQSSRWIAEPLHLLDCCLVSNGAIAVIVTSTERARDLAQPLVRLLGWAQAHPGEQNEQGSEFGIRSGAAESGPAALKMAGVVLSEVDVAEIYDCFTFTTLLTLEDYGFCAKGEGGAFVASGALEPGSAIPINTGGGQLSSYYMWGMTPLSEAIMQTRGQTGERQSARHDIVLVSGNGGVLDHHSTLVLGSAAT
jgi:acetyl-CoA acetyltransferase